MTKFDNPARCLNQIHNRDLRVPANQPLIQWSGSSYRMLPKLRTDYRLDKIVTAGSTEFEKLILLRDWVHNRFTHHSSNYPAEFDTLYILEHAERGERCRCIEYSFVLADVYRDMGWPARLIRLEGEKGAHVVSEVYSHGFGKWIMMDGQHAAQVLRDGIPINVYEFQQAVLSQQDTELKPYHPDHDLYYITWNAGYLRYLMYPQDLSYGKQLSTLLVLTPPKDPGPDEKPVYLVTYGTTYIVIYDPQVVYSQVVSSVKREFQV